MASYAGAITDFNPYVQQIPEAYTKVGMLKEQQYQAGVAETQQVIDKIAGLDIANEGGRNYLRARVDELTGALNKYSQVDFSNRNNVAQLQSLARPLYQDENIVTDVINTSIYRNYQKQVAAKAKTGDLDPIQQYYEQQEVSKWLYNKAAGTDYTGRMNPNDSTYEKINKKVLDFKSKLKPDTRYTAGDTFLYGSKAYKVSELTELFYNQILDGNDREVLAHNTMYNDTLRFNQDPNTPKVDLINIYQGKKTNNEIELKKVNLQLSTLKDTNSADYQSLLRDKGILESNINTYNQAISSFQRTNPLDESQRMGIYTNISGEYYKDSIRSIFESEDLKPEYRDDVKQSRDHANSTLNAAVAKGTVAYTQLKDNNGQPMWDANGNPIMGIRAVLDENNDPTILEKQSDLIQTVDANGNIIFSPRPSGSRSKKTNPLVSLLQGASGELANYNVAGEDDIVHLTKDILSNQYFSLDGAIQQNVLALTNTLSRASTSGFKTSDYYNIEQVPGPDGKDQAAMVWKSPEKKKEFMGYIEMMNSAYQIEAADGDKANKSFTRFINGELDATSKELGLEGVDPETVKQLMSLKGKNAILSAMDEVFKDKNVIGNLTGISQAIAQKDLIAKPWRKVLFANAKNQADRDILSRMTDEDIMRLNAPDQRSIANIFNVPESAAKKMEDNPFTLKWTPNGNGTYTVTAYSGFDNPVAAVLGRNVPQSVVDKQKEDNPKIKEQYSKYTGGVQPGEEISVFGRKTLELARDPNLMEMLTGGSSNPFGLSVGTITKANDELKNIYSVIRQNVTRSMSLLNIPENKQDKDAIMQSITNSLINQAGSKLLTDPSFIQLGQDDVQSITSVTDITGASNKTVGDFFNNSGFVNLKIKYQNADGKEKEGFAAFNVDRILATDPSFASKFSKYFAGLKYAREGAAIRAKAYIDPTGGYQSYAGSSTDDDDFSMHTINSQDGHQIPIWYRVVSYGNAAAIGNKINNTNLDNDRYAIQLQVNTPSGKQNVFFKTLAGNIRQYNTPEEALYQLKDELFQTLPLDHKADLIKDGSGKTTPNYFIDFNQNRPSIRGLFNLQLRLNGVTVPTMEEMKQAYADLIAGKSTEIDANLLKFSPIF